MLICRAVRGAASYCDGVLVVVRCSDSEVDDAEADRDDADVRLA
jgi:hypothetical protein